MKGKTSAENSIIRKRQRPTVIVHYHRRFIEHTHLIVPTLVSDAICKEMSRFVHLAFTVLSSSYFLAFWYLQCT